MTSEEKPKPEYAKAITGILAIIIFVVWWTHGNKTDAPATSTPQVVQAASGDTRAVLLARVGLINFSWHKTAFDTVMVVSFTILNPTEYGFKDFEVTCTHSGPSGTSIDSNTRTIYSAVPPHSTKRITDFQMGFIHSQATTSYCRVSNLVPADIAEEKKPIKKTVRRTPDDTDQPLEERGGWVVAPEKR